MKIMSYIQKTIYALFLLALFSGCTDEVLDGGGNGSTPIEEGKLVDVKFVLDQAGEETVLTKGWDSDHGPEVDELLFLQYKGENLVYAWYTDEEKDFLPPTKSDYDFEGWGAKSRVVKVKLLSGEDYQVYVVANVDLDDDTEYIEEEDDDRGPVNLENKNILNEFGTLDKLRTWTRNNSNFLDDDDKKESEDKKNKYPDDDDIMFGIASNESENGLANKKNYDYTKMATNFSGEYESLNDDSKNDYYVKIEEGSSICATLYPPYSKVTLTIEKDDSFNANLTITSVKLVNRPKDYSLFSGYSLSGEGSDDHGNSLFEIQTEGVSIDELSGQPSKSIILYENMAGTVEDKMNPFGTSIDLKQPGYPYTYIEVKGYYQDDASEGNVVYRFILGKDAKTDCNVERNVHYIVKMKLLNDGGVNKPSWSVNYDGEKPKPDPEESAISIVSDLTRLDAHATVSPITFTNLKAGTYTLSIEQRNGSIKNHGGSLVAVVEGEGVVIEKGDSGNNNSFTLDQNMKKVVLSYRQDSWFSEDQNKNSNGHSLNKPEDVAQANCNEYIVNVYFGKMKEELIGEIEVKQYPPVVVYPDPLLEVENGEEVPIKSLDRWTTVTYMERFEDDHNLKPEGWKNWNIVDLSNLQLQSYLYNERLFDQNNKNNSEECYWLNLYGPLTLKGNGQKPNYQRVRIGDDVWPYLLSSSNKERYIIQLY